MTLTITPIQAATAGQSAVPDVALQPGTVVTAQVLALLDANLVRIAIANLTLDVATTTPLQPGQSLQLAVAQTKTGLSLTPVASDSATAARDSAVILDDIPLAPNLPAQADAARPALTPLEARAVAAAVQTAATKQTGLSPLFANLTRAVTSGSLPQPVLVAAAQVLALRQPRDQAFTGADIKAALTTSGLLSEASRAAGTTSQSMPDLKAALIVLRHTLSTWLGRSIDTANVTTQPATPDSAAAPAATLRTAAGKTVLTPTQIVAVNAGETDAGVLAKTLLSNVAAGSNGQAPVTEDTSALARGTQPLQQPSSRTTVPPPFRDALPAAQAVAMPSLAPEAEPATVAQQLIADTDGALARQTLLQVASLPDQVSGPRNEAMQPRWNFEIPFVTPQGTAMAQFEVARDGSASEVEAAKRVWRARFSIDIEPAGPVHALISFSGDTTSVKMWAERPATAETLRAGAKQLGQSLDRAALKTGDIVIADGAPMRAARPPAGHFLNRAS